MKNLTVASSRDERIVHVAINKSFLKEYRTNEFSKVYMEDEQEFQLSLFNPYTYTIGLKIQFNGDSESKSLLVLRPGERVWLDRYLDNDHKMKFSTYEVKNNKSSREAIRDNGYIIIKAYKEKQEVYSYTHIVNQPYISTPSAPNIDPFWYNKLTITCDTDANTDKNISSFITTGSLTGSVRSVDSTNQNISATSANYVASYANTDYVNANYVNTDYANTDYVNANYVNTDYANTSLTTGRVEKGNKSSQTFEHSNKDFEYFAFKTEKFKILPMSEKEIHANDLQKRFCPNCGKKIKAGFRFCPYCGAQQ